MIRICCIAVLKVKFGRVVPDRRVLTEITVVGMPADSIHILLCRLLLIVAYYLLLELTDGMTYLMHWKDSMLYQSIVQQGLNDREYLKL